MSQPIQISVLIVTYNSAEYLSVCLNELARSKNVELEVIVVDNDSKDDSADIAEAHSVVTKTIRTGANLGCAGGNNVAWRAATHPYIVMLNADCAVERDCLAELVKPLRDDPQVGVTGAKLYYPNTRTIQHAGGILHPNSLAEHPGVREKDEGQYDTPRDVDYVTGALVAFRREDMEALGGLDEEFHPAYYEETDFCVRIRRSGKVVRYIPSSVGYHYESVGLGLRSYKLIKMSCEARMKFVVKNYTLVSFLLEFLPFELKWLCGPFAKRIRRVLLRSYVSGAMFALRCLFRFSKRPRGVKSRL